MGMIQARGCTEYMKVGYTFTKIGIRNGYGFEARGGARNFPIEGLELPTGGLK